MSQNYYQTAKSILIHLVFWIFWLVVPFLFSMADGRGLPSPRAHFFFRSFLTMSLFYFNYLWLVEKTLFEHKIGRFAVINFGLIIALTALTFYSYGFFSPELPLVTGPDSMEGAQSLRHNRPPIFSILLGTFFSYLFVTSISITVKAITRWFIMDAQRKTLENEHLKSELNNLKLQLNPHFFFNTLNNIYALIQLNQEKAQEAVHRLAKLMRYHLYETNAEKVSLNGEMEFLESYISLMKMRSTSMLEVVFNYSIENKRALIAPLLFVPLVENAFKYGISNDHKSFINIHIQEKGGELSAWVKNTVFVNPDALANHSGIGLENLKKRLSLIYPGQYTIDAIQEGPEFIVHLNIHLTRI